MSARLNCNHRIADMPQLFMDIVARFFCPYRIHANKQIDTRFKYICQGRQEGDIRVGFTSFPF